DAALAVVGHALVCVRARGPVRLLHADAADAAEAGDAVGAGRAAGLAGGGATDVRAAGLQHAGRAGARGVAAPRHGLRAGRARIHAEDGPGRVLAARARAVAEPVQPAGGDARVVALADGILTVGDVLAGALAAGDRARLARPRAGRHAADALRADLRIALRVGAAAGAGRLGPAAAPDAAVGGDAVGVRRAGRAARLAVRRALE